MNDYRKCAEEIKARIKQELFEKEKTTLSYLDQYLVKNDNMIKGKILKELETESGDADFVRIVFDMNDFKSFEGVTRTTHDDFCTKDFLITRNFLKDTIKKHRVGFEVKDRWLLIDIDSKTETDIDTSLEGLSNLFQEDGIGYNEISVILDEKQSDEIAIVFTRTDHNTIIITSVR